MQPLLTTTAAILAISLAATSVQAQDLTFSAGATVTSRYVSNGLEQTDGLAFQPWAEIETGGFYFGLWASNVSSEIVGHSSELNLLAGFRNEFGNLSYDVGYARYVYFDPRDNCCGEFSLNLEAELVPQFSLGTNVKYDPDSKVSNVSLGAWLALHEALSFDANIGKISDGGQQYWSVGATYGFNENFSASLRWHDTDISKGLAVLSVDYGFSLP
jgi:uncharacterized protein (TIGR02001 family)